ncbi:hypothetical protein C8Q72DRAFT_824228 [Fomitopsis betulina]|nr:hypothetical protein C8Q72DRAFT_824228 [Fomitopsis betulina]
MGIFRALLRVSGIAVLLGGQAPASKLQGSRAPAKKLLELWSSRGLEAGGGRWRRRFSGFAGKYFLAACATGVTRR